MILDVVFGLPIDKIFKYRFLSSEREVFPGSRVKAPFRNEVKIGYVVGREEKEMEGLKEIKELLDDVPVINEDILKLTQWMASHYYASWGECIESSLPTALKRGKKFLRPRKEYSINADKAFKKPLQLTASQKKALDVLKQKPLDEFNTFLLYGVTGSGKTEIYLRIIELALKQGKSALVLVPEIALTPQTISRFKMRLGDKISVLHSRLTEAQKFQEWRKLKEGENKICIGTRSAIFAPVQNLGLIVIDEEHDSSYKQSESPRYHARDVALKRAEISSCPLILGSATPSIESYYNAIEGRYTLLELPQRVEKKKMPQVEIIDLNDIKRRKNRALIFSPVLKQELSNVLDRKMQAILFLNRRGFSTFIFCSKCGYIAQCPRCKIALTYHTKENKLVCHYCNYKEDKPEICPQCKSKYLTFRGFGTQKVESELNRLFPAARIARLDSDALKKRGKLEQILGDFKAKKLDFLIGTQIVAKGHDFPNVELVGVILADLSLNIIDFRSGERTFSLLTQVAGRSGRGKNKGKVIIQTYNPQHYTIRTSLKPDYKSFYAEEIKKRKALGFPPFNELIRLELRHKREEKVEKVSEMLKKELAKHCKGSFEILGPVPNPVPKIRNLYRWTLLLKGKNVEQILRLLYNIIGFRRKIKGLNIIVDVNPYEN